MLLILSVHALRSNKLIILNNSEFNDLEIILKDNLGKDYFKMYDYTYFEIGSRVFVLPKMFSAKDFNLPKFEGGAKEIIQKCIDYVSNYNYTKLQSSPSEMVRSGQGNCQAMSLLLDSILQKHGLDSSLVVESNHMRNKVELDDKFYYIDLAKGSLVIE